MEHHICNEHLPLHISQLQLPPPCSVLDRVCSWSIEVIRLGMITVAGLDTLARPDCHNVNTYTFYIVTLISMTHDKHGYPSK